MSADLGNVSIISPVDANNGSGTHPSWLGSAAPSSIDDAGRALQGAVAREWENRSYPTSTGTAPAFVVAYTTAPAALRSGQTYTFTAHAAAVGTDTLNANALGAKGIKKVVAGVKTATAANDFYTNDKITCVYDGTDMVWENKTADLSTAALLASANVFTANQTIRSSDAGAGQDPTLNFDRASASPAANDIMGALNFTGRDSGAATQQYAAIFAEIVDPTAASEDGRLRVRTLRAGANSDILIESGGLAMPGATGGIQAAEGAINATAIYDDGVLLTSGGMTLIATLTTTSGTTQSATNLGPSSYNKYYIEVAGVSFTVNSLDLTLALSGNNGANYGTAVPITIANQAADTWSGWFEIGNINSTSRWGATIPAIPPIARSSDGSTLLTIITVQPGKNVTGASGAVDAIQFAGGTFDAGTIRIYGVK